MSRTIIVEPQQRLPLTCTRAGTCCHGKEVWVNPWEVARLARALGVGVAELQRARLCDGGIRLRFDGPAGWRGQAACTLYDPGSGCVAHSGRPLACRLYPLGRERQGEAVRYVHDGPAFPCLAGCPDVERLPRLTVADYLAGQQTTEGETVGDAYLELAQDLAEGAFVLVFDSGLVASGHRGLLARWRATRRLGHAERAASVPPELLALLLDPELDPADGRAFVGEHARRLQERAQADFASLRDANALADASCAMLALALHLGRAVGADSGALGDHWLAIAERQGMR